MPEQDHEAEVTRLRRTFRVAVIAAALGATVGAGVVITVVRAVFSVIDRPASQATKAENPKGSPLAQKSNTQAQASTQAPAAASPRRVEEPPRPAPQQAACKEQTWPYLDGKCLTPADDRAPTDVARNGAAASPPVAPEAPATPAVAAPTPVPPAPANAQTTAPSTTAPSVVTARPETTGSAVQAQPAVVPQPQTGAVATTGAPLSDTTADSDKKSRKKAGRSRSEQKVGRADDKGTDRRFTNRADSADRNAPNRDASNQRSRYSGARDSDLDDEATPETRPLVVVPARSRTDGSGATATRQKRVVRSRPELDSPVVEEREGLRRDTSDDGGRGFFGGLLGGARD